MKNPFPAETQMQKLHAPWSTALGCCSSCPASATLPEHRHCDCGQQRQCNGEIQTFAHIHIQQKSTTSGTTLQTGGM